MVADRRAVLQTRLAYGFGAVASGVMVAGLSGAVLQVYLNQVVGLSALSVGTIILVSLIADSLVDPIIGYWSDHVRSGRGRRHPFMYAAALPIALSTYFLWNAPARLQGGLLMTFTVIMMITVRIAASLYVIPSDALLPELTTDYDERTTLTSYRWFFGILGGSGVSYLLNAVFLRTSPANPLGILNRNGYAHFGLLSAVIILLSITVSAAATQRRARLFVPVPHAAITFGGLANIRNMMANPSLVALLLGGLLGGINGGIALGLSTYLLVHFWGLDPGQYAPLIPLGSLGSILAVFAAPAIAKRLGKKLAAIGLFSTSIVTTAAPILLRQTALLGGSGWISVLVILDGAFTASISVAGYILVGSMLADVVEDVAARTGVRAEGLLYAVNGLLVKFTGGIGAFIAGIMLTVVGFPPHALRGSVPAPIISHLVMIYLPVTMIVSAASVAVLGLYRIDRSTQERNAARLHDLR